MTTTIEGLRCLYSCRSPFVAGKYTMKWRGKTTWLKITSCSTDCCHNEQHEVKVIRYDKQVMNKNKHMEEKLTM